MAAAATNIYLPLKFTQLVDLVKALPQKEKQRLMNVLEQEKQGEIPEWQKKEVRKRLKDLQKNPSKALTWNEASRKIKQLAK